MGFFGTSASLFSDVSLVIQAVILVSFLYGWRYARRKLTNEHYKIMTAGFVLNLAFVGGYMIRSLLTEGSGGFLGPEFVKDFVYLPTVIVHGVASILAFALAGVTIYYGYTRTVQKKKRLFTKSPQRSVHRILGLLTLATWSLSFATGVVVYLLLYVLYPA